MVAGVVALGCLALAPSASAYIYWTNPAPDGSSVGSIARADNDGTNVDLNFIPNLNDPAGVAVDGQHIYWANRSTASIGRANLDGTGVNVAFIAGAGGSNYLAGGLAVDSSHVFWTSFPTSVGGSGALGRANIDGSGANPSFLSGLTFVRSPYSVAIGGPYLFWSNTDLNTGADDSAIGRVGLDGTPPPNGSFISLGTTTGIVPTATAADSGHVYFLLTYAAVGSLAIFRTDLDGGDLDTISQASATGGMAVRDGRLYLANTVEGTISRMNTDGTDPDFALITKAGNPNGLAVDGLSTPAGDLTVGKLTRNKRRGTAKLTVSVNGPGEVALAGDGLKPATAQAAGPGDVGLAVKATGSKRKKLKRKGKVKLAAELTFTPARGAADSESAKLKLVRK